MAMPSNQAAPASDAAFGGIFEASPQATLLIEPNADRIVDANPAACRLLGYDRALLRSLTFSALHPGQLPALVVFTQAVQAKGTYWTHTLSARDAAGHELALEYEASMLTRTGDPAPRLLLIMTDLAERRRRAADAEADLAMRGGIAQWQRVERFFRDVERENQLILRAAGEGIYGVNAEGRTTFVNPAAERMLGWSAEELVGRDMHSVVHHSHADGSHYPGHDCPIYAAFRDGAVHHVDHEVFWRKDGTSFWVDYTSTPIRDHGVLIGAVIVFRDVSQRHEAEEKLRAAHDEVDRLRKRLELENAYLQEQIRLDSNHHGIIGRGAAIQKTLKQVELVAPTNASVLITGESGTGKELVARAIHEASRRSNRPLIRVDCAGVADDEFDSELFGHAKGAFAGALRDRIGRFELADGGTLFLDEIGAIPLALQGKLLRVLEEGAFERIGEERTRQVDVRVIAATNRDLKAQVRRGGFREDLYFKLNVFPIEMVPLRERREDIAPLAVHLLREASRKLKCGELRLTEGDARRLTQYAWPGNVRELQNVIERAAILARNGRVRIDLPDTAAAIQVGGRASASAGKPPVLTDDDRRERDRINILAALEACGGKVSGRGGAAELLDIKPTTLASRIKALGIRYERASRADSADRRV
jgi:PAS domain S-box-containing protein